MAENYLLGMDMGSTNIKANIMDTKGNVIVMRHKVKSCALADFNAVNRENKESCQGKRFSERMSFTRFCANGNRPAFIGGGSERDETAVK